MAPYSEIDSARFGFPVGKDYAITVSSLPAVIEAARSQGIRLLLARCSAGDWGTTHALERRGAQLMDTLLYFRRDLKGESEARAPSASGVRLSAPQDADAVEQVARGAFADYDGHYHVDPRLDRAAVAEIYPSWARRMVQDPSAADAVLVAEVDGAVAGFGALKAAGDTLDAMLYAVSPDFRRRGVYRNLVAASCDWARDARFSAMDYSTQLTNVAAQRVVVQSGFVPSRAFYTFHLWLDR